MDGGESVKIIKETMKKVCLIIPTLQAGGMERVMSEFANYLSLKGYFVHIILMNTQAPFFILNKNIKVIQPRKSFRNTPLDALRLFYYMRKSVKEINPVTILSFGERYNSYTLLALAGLKIPIYISDRSSPKKKLSKFYLILSQLIYPSASGIIAQTNTAAEYMIKRLGRRSPKISVVPNPLRKIHNNLSAKKENIIIAVGRLVSEKRYDRLFRIISSLEDKTWKVLIIGEGILKHYLEKEIQLLGLANRVELLGTSNKIDDYLSKSKIFVLTSDSEGFPNSLCEAMAHGLACISFDCVAGPGDIIENNINGLLIEDGKIDTFVAMLNRLIDDEVKREYLGENAKSIQNTLEMTKVFSQYESFIINSN